MKFDGGVRLRLQYRGDLSRYLGHVRNDNDIYELAPKKIENSTFWRVFFLRLPTFFFISEFQYGQKWCLN